MSDIYHINDLFWTIQGEGANAGRRALFVRMPYCNLECEWCDTSFNSFQKFSAPEFSAVASKVEWSDRFAVVTGGEPILHKHTPPIVHHLKQMGFEVACESNGTVESEVYRLFDFVTVSPKRQSVLAGWPPYHISDAAAKYAHEFKYVVDKNFDWKILERHNVRDGRRYSLSPEFGRFQESVEEINNFIQRNGAWRISLQTHKWMNVK